MHPKLTYLQKIYGLRILAFALGFQTTKEVKQTIFLTQNQEAVIDALDLFYNTLCPSQDKITDNKKITKVQRGQAQMCCTLLMGTNFSLPDKNDYVAPLYFLHEWTKGNYQTLKPSSITRTAHDFLNDVWL